MRKRAVIEEEATANTSEVSGALRPAGSLRRVFGGAASIAAVLYLTVVTLASVLAPVIAPYNQNQANFIALLETPNAHHWLGTDELGRDLLSRLIYGGRVSLLGAGEAVLVFLVLGVVVGLIAGYMGGWIDVAVVWISDVMFALPAIVLILAVLAIFANNATAAMLLLGIFGAPSLAMIVRNATRAVRAEQYIAAAKVSGLRPWQIIVRHVLPRVSGPIIVQTSLFSGTALIFQTGLDFLGLGTQPPNASWGSMVAEGSAYLGSDPWMIIPSGVTIALTIMSFVLIGDAVRDGSPTLRKSVVKLDRRARRKLDSIDQRSAVGVQPHDGDEESSGTPTSSPTTFADARAMVASSDGVRARGGVLLSVHGLCVGFANGAGGVTPALDDVGFELRAGDVLGIVGESGSGKTLAAMAIMGLLPSGARITGGSCTFDRMPLEDSGKTKWGDIRGSQIAMIAQEPNASLDPAFTVGSQLLEVVRRHRPGSRAESRAEVLRLLELVRLPDPRNVVRRYPHQLSGGMAQRVAIAAALAGKPRLLIADEPTTALDVTVQSEILELLRSLQRETGLTIVLVSHDWGVIAQLCDSVIVMYAGQVVEDGNIEAIFDAPKHPYTRALMEANPYYAKVPRTPLTAIKGTVPALGSWPSGCHFAPRCSLCREDCVEHPIQEIDLSPNHRTRCLHHDQLTDFAVQLREGT